MNRSRFSVCAVVCVIAIISTSAMAQKLAVASDAPNATRAITAKDLVELREIEAPVASPNGRYVAFHLMRADIESNSYLGSWQVIDIGIGALPREVGDAGVIRPRPTLTGHIGGRVRPTSRPKWSKDSKHVAYLKEMHGEVQIWLSDIQSGAQTQLTYNHADVVEFVWSHRNDRLYFKTLDKTRLEERNDLAAESAQGMLYDQRFTPQYSVVPRVIRRVSDQLWVYDLTSATETHATTDQVDDYREIVRQVAREQRPLARSVTTSTDGRFAAWAQPLEILEDGSVAIHPVAQLHFGETSAQSPLASCTATECIGLIYDIWISDDQSEVYFSRRQGHNNTEFGYFAWTIATGDVRALFSRYDEWLNDCTKAGFYLVCVYSAPTTPPKLATLDVRDGTFASEFDPNPQFRNIRFSEVRRYDWISEGLPWARNGYGHFVLPLDFDPTKMYPLVITQYYSQGFLRGGVGNEYPIHLFAANGIAVLSIERPIPWELTAKVSDGDDLQHTLFTHTPNDWDIGLESLETGLDVILATGLIDLDRVGITGLSDGAVKAFHGLVNSPERYAAAAVSSTAWDPILFFTTDFDHRRKLKHYGFDDPYKSRRNLWRIVSPIHNIDKISAPILMHISDHELIHATQTITMLSEAGKPYEARVFQGEYHVKWQPRHRDAIYQRNIDWFRFWLDGFEDPDPRKGAQYQRWRELRRQRNKEAR